METTASIRKHPIHVMLISFPIGLWAFSLVCDLVQFFGWGGTEWETVAYFTMAGGIVTALIAAIPGFIDLLGITERKLKRIGLVHMILNLTIVGLYVVNLFLRRGALAADDKLPLILSIISIALLLVSGWLGGELVHVYRVSVAEPTAPGPRT
jgi:uncharacterized membrane protein